MAGGGVGVQAKSSRKLVLPIKLSNLIFDTLE